ncbi:uncharacterized protein LOC125716065 [Brienomyrus brachyistius]|uniref:uncharacterized protein LOC125716065 n=1 Tax=Brienomyrus brachyistius TaxID=42636 RepID=UPI0020B36AFE|nr:uncharacterized protein LOC125716065 [Brienomyrus brachyistius]
MAIANFFKNFRSTHLLGATGLVVAAAGTAYLVWRLRERAEPEEDQQHLEAPIDDVAGEDQQQLETPMDNAADKDQQQLEAPVDNVAGDDQQQLETPMDNAADKDQQQLEAPVDNVAGEDQQQLETPVDDVADEDQQQLESPVDYDNGDQQHLETPEDDVADKNQQQLESPADGDQHPILDEIVEDYSRHLTASDCHPLPGHPLLGARTLISRGKKHLKQVRAIILGRLRIVNKRAIRAPSTGNPK